MRPFLRALLKAVGLAVPTVQASSEAAAQPPSTHIETGVPSAAAVRGDRGDDGSMVELVKALAHDPVLRRRFAADPDAVFREMNVAPNAFRLPERLDEAAVERFVSSWTGPSGPPVARPAEASTGAELISMSGPIAVYGPPPAPLPTPPKRRDQVVPPAKPRPPAPVPPLVVPPQPPAPVPLNGPPPTAEPDLVPGPDPAPAPVYGPPPGPPRR